MDDAIRDLAKKAGVASDWVDATGQPQRVSIGSLRAILQALGFPCATAKAVAESRARLERTTREARGFITAQAGTPIELNGLSEKPIAAELVLEDGDIVPLALGVHASRATIPPIGKLGYHRLRLADREIALAIAPPRCVTLRDIAPGEKLYGLAVQLYSLRRAQDQGVGDCAALREFALSAAREGADAVALSPTHSLFAADPSHHGPYSPSNRLFFNPVFADPAAIFGTERATAARAAAGEHEVADGPLIDWARAARAKYALLRRLFDDFRSTDLTTGTALAADFHAFVRDGGARLREHALFESLHEHWLTAHEPKWNWADWPPQWRAPSADGALRFAEANPRAVQFHEFLQWIAAASFGAVQRAARDAGMRIGLISDLAVGMNPGGSHAWSRQQDLLLGLSIGAPPDLINSRGQDWGLTGFSPQSLVASGFEPFIATLRSALRHAGGVRIDHVMGLARLWLVPHGASPTEGAYLTYPVDDLLRLAALESHRHNAIVIGEDLGTVEPEFRKRLSAVGIAGMDVLWFQRKGRAFLPPRDWRRDAVAMTTTHDLPTVAGWWSGADIAMRDELGLVPDKRSETEQRARDRAALWRAFKRAGATRSNEPAPADSAPAVDVAIAYTAQSPAPLALIPVEDILGLAEQPNLPGTVDEHPNWRRRLPATAAEILQTPQARARIKTLRERK